VYYHREYRDSLSRRDDAAGAAIYTCTTHQLSLALLIASATSGAIVGDNLGFWLGCEGGYRLVHRYGHSVRLNERKLKLGLYLFCGRFVVVLLPGRRGQQVP
jgi:membrane protein DedA with SNARE-associated domain